ncbi:MAG: oligosaccharide flippase family protein [Prosthecobacter sp.]|uniref:oligosaccharide flippase family protein n=1 Tax=Prosthecobacter sp. TaxID=1965333 RepID=UPI003903D555
MNLSTLLHRLRASTIARNTGSMLLGHGLRTAIQGAYFILLTRAIGVHGYGAFVGVMAFVGIAAPFASWGSGNILIKQVARDRSLFGIYWGNALAITQISGVILTILLLLLSRFVLPGSISVLLFLSVAVADLIFARLMDVGGQAFQAFEKLGQTARLQVLASLVKLLAVVFLFALPSPVPVVWWGWMYLGSTVVGALVTAWLVRRELGKSKLATERIGAELREGFHFSVSLSAQNIYNDIDKTMLVYYSTLAATGTYGAAYRIIDIAFTPVRALLSASYAGFFRHGAKGVRESFAYAKRFLPHVAIYGLAAGIALYAAAPVVPLMLGHEYDDTVDAVRWLALLPFLKAMHYFAADTLTGAGFQGLRSRIQALMAVFNVGINFWLIPAYSWLGAAWSSLLTDGLLALCLWLVVASKIKNHDAQTR